MKACLASATVRAPVGSARSQVGAEHVLVEDGAVVPAGPVCQRSCMPLRTRTAALVSGGWCLALMLVEYVSTKAGPSYWAHWAVARGAVVAVDFYCGLERASRLACGGRDRRAGTARPATMPAEPARRGAAADRVLLPWTSCCSFSVRWAKPRGLGGGAAGTDICEHHSRAPAVNGSYGGPVSTAPARWLTVASRESPLAQKPRPRWRPGLRARVYWVRPPLRASCSTSSVTASEAARPAAFTMSNILRPMTAWAWTAGWVAP